MSRHQSRNLSRQFMDTSFVSNSSPTSTSRSIKSETQYQFSNDVEETIDPEFMNSLITITVRGGEASG